MTSPVTKPHIELPFGGKWNVYLWRGGPFDCYGTPEEIQACWPFIKARIDEKLIRHHAQQWKGPGMSLADDEMTQGYRDGLADDRDDLPESLANRSAAYRHGWANGRDDRLRKPRLRAIIMRQLARLAILEDEARR